MTNHVTGSGSAEYTVNQTLNQSEMRAIVAALWNLEPQQVDFALDYEEWRSTNAYIFTAVYASRTNIGIAIGCAFVLYGNQTRIELEYGSDDNYNPQFPLTELGYALPALFTAALQSLLLLSL